MAVVSAVVGWFVVLRRQSFAAHTVSAVAFPGAAGALLLGLSAVYGHFTLCVAAALVIAALRGGGEHEESALTGTVQAFLLASGFLFTALYRGLLEGPQTISDVLMDQVEFADVIVLNKLDLVDKESADRLRATLTRLNPAARLVPAVHGRVTVGDVLGTSLFDLERAQQAPGWVRELNGDHVPETEEYGISSTVFRSELPFHPGRLWTFVTEELGSGAYGQILRSKGFFTLASRPHVTGLWSQAGSVARFEPSAARDTESPECQELVFIGTHLHADALHAALTDCLMGDEESLPPTDPFPTWATYGIDGTCEHEHPELVAGP
ncbi:GTP-binding protein [Streptomyces sp. NPDC004059]